MNTIERLKECTTSIGTMCGDGSPPKMSIPVREDDDDIFITVTCLKAAAEIEQLAAENKVLRDANTNLETHNVMLRAAIKGIIKVADRKTDEFDAAKEALKREHITDDSPCWCCPEVNYTDPDTGVSVIVHKEPQ
jgi:hypothetical protein